MTPGFLDGMLLAATAADDRGAAQARPGLAAGLSRALEARASRLEALDADARRAEVRRLAGGLRAIDESAELPARARAILAPALPLPVGRKWAAHAPPVRRGFRVHPDLKATLRRFAEPCDPGARAAELEAAASADARLHRWVERCGPGESPERVLGALALGASGDTRGDATSNPWRRIGAELAAVWESPWRR
ncbi:MAG: hypothetical protein H6719_10810 [Sandaracinaceae bacterium]|nr:hypothetical protein [Sandaracinaceae bacterium]